MTTTASSPASSPDQTAASAGAPTAVASPVGVPLARRPRRAPVRREPTPRAAARALRRTAPRTTSRTWVRRGLPSTPVASVGARPVDTAMGVLVVGLLFVPVAVWTQGAPLAFAGLGVALAVVAYLSWARRIVVGADYLAIRQLGRYHVASADHVRHLELRAMQGGMLCLHTDDGRCMRLRRVEVEREEISAALRELAGCGTSTRDRSVCALLGLEHSEERTLDRYRPAAAA